MPPDSLRFRFARLRPVLSDLVLAGLLLAALAVLVLAGPVIAGEVEADVSPAPWQLWPANGGETESQQHPAGFRGLTGLEFAFREADGSGLRRGLFFSVGDGLRIGARGSFDPGSGKLRAIFALKLDF